MSTKKLRVGFVPEHFSTPLFLAEKHGFFKQRNLEVEFLPYPSGSGHLIQSLGDNSLDVTVGLTDAFVKGVRINNLDSYKLVGTYVESPLCWAISTGANRSIADASELEGAIAGVSRMGSGSDVMSKVLQMQRGWSKPFTYEINNDFKNLRDGVNHVGQAHKTDFFMWEHFTSKRYYDSGEIKRIGEIYTPWPSWIIAGRGEIVDDAQGSGLQDFLAAVQEGITYFEANTDEAIEYIYNTFDYSEEDARAWLKTVKFSKDVSTYDPAMVDKTAQTLKDASN